MGNNIMKRCKKCRKLYIENDIDKGKGCYHCEMEARKDGK